MDSVSFHEFQPTIVWPERTRSKAFWRESPAPTPRKVKRAKSSELRPTQKGQPRPYRPLEPKLTDREDPAEAMELTPGGREVAVTQAEPGSKFTAMLAALILEWLAYASTQGIGKQFPITNLDVEVAEMPPLMTLADDDASQRIEAWACIRLRRSARRRS